MDISSSLSYVLLTSSGLLSPLLLPAVTPLLPLLAQATLNGPNVPNTVPQAAACALPSTCHALSPPHNPHPSASPRNLYSSSGLIPAMPGLRPDHTHSPHTPRTVRPAVCFHSSLPFFHHTCGRLDSGAKLPRFKAPLHGLVANRLNFLSLSFFICNETSPSLSWEVK